MMSKEAIIERIMLDADAECEKILSDARAQADKIEQTTREHNEQMLSLVKKESEERALSVKEGKAASARLDCAKITLQEKRRVIDVVYACALNALVNLDEKQTLAVANRLLEQYAEEGDEICFAQSYAYPKQTLALPVVKEKKLKQGAILPELQGGFMLVGQTSDKNVSYEALLNEDREQNFASLTQKLFPNR